jgi:uncharacterized protein (TIGR03790 family)
VGWVFVLALGLTAIARADTTDASTNGAPTPPPPRPLLAPNPSAASTYLQMHPELAEPSANQSSLSLRPDTASTNSPPEVIPPGSGIFPDTFHEPASMQEAEDLASHLLVVYNSNDPDSQGLAEYYASRRGIPAERLLAISSPVTEEITRAQFEDTIRSPIISYLTQKDWMARETQRVRVGARYLDLLVATRNDIWAIVLMRGVPLKIAPDPSDVDSMEYEPALQTNAAAVDNELALLPVFGLPTGGFVPNIFYDDQVSGIKRVGRDLARNMVLVTRLDGPKVSDVRRMIDDSLEAETHRLAGEAVVDTRGFTDEKGGYTMGDDWLRNARDMLVQDGWGVKFDDKPEVLPPTDPSNQVALYLGWYNADAVGPWITAPNRFVPGAIAYHLHSFSAATVRSETSNWVGPLIAHGADATMGMVYEPYLALTPHEDIFTRRLLQGDYFAEAAYASERALSWMMTVVGDPLYRPFRKPLDSALAEASTPRTAHDDWILLQKVRRELLAGQIEDKTDSLRQALEIPGAGAVAEEGLGDLLEKVNDPDALPAAADAYRKAFEMDEVPVDRMRIGLKLAAHYGAHNSNTREQGELEKLWSLDPENAKRFGVPNPVVPATALMPVNDAVGNQPTFPAKPGPGDRPQLPQLPKPTPLPQPQ